MQSSTKYTLIVIAIVLIGFLTAVIFFTDAMPIVVQRIYYTVVYKVSPAAKSSAFLAKAHQAHPPSSGQPANPYSFEYSQEDKPTIIKDSMLCEACHGNMRQQKNGKPKYYIHNKMLSKKFVDFYCTNCHKKVDLGKRTSEHATIRVDRRLCTKCHESKEFLPEAELKKIAGKLGKKVPLLFLIIRHGRDKATGMQWIINHRKIAPEVGVDKCRRCHKKGRELDFCTDCHIDPERMRN